jgi:Glycosyl hydrolase family 99
LSIVVASLAWPAGAGAAQLTIGAYYYAWYGSNGEQWRLGAPRLQLDQPEQPLLGDYSSADPAVIAQHFEWAQEYGVNLFFCSWRGPGTSDDVTIREDLLPSPARGPTQIALMYESLERLGMGPDDRIQLTADSTQRMVDDFDYMARTYFDRPGYYRINGRPVVIVYASRILRGNVAGAILAIRLHLLTTYGIDPYLIGDEVDWDLPPDPNRIGLFDAITGYTLYSRTQQPGWPSQLGYVQALRRRLRQFQRAAKADGVAFIPVALPGLNTRAVRPQEGEHVLPRELGPRSSQVSLFASTLALAGSFVDPSLDLLNVTSWNEWNEDTQIEPTAIGPPQTTGPTGLTQGYAYQPYGFSLLELLRRFRNSWELKAHPRRRPAARREAADGGSCVRPAVLLTGEAGHCRPFAAFSRPLPPNPIADTPSVAQP